MAAPRAKFMFDADFGSGAGRSSPEYAATLAEAEARGFRNGRAAAEQDSERRTTEAFEQIAAGIKRMVAGLAAVEARLEAETVEVAVAVGRKLAPALIAREPLEEVAALASDCFKQLIAAPHVAVRVNDTLLTMAREQLDAIARGCGFEGRVIVIAEPDIAVGDCRIDWADGGLTRDHAAVEAVIAEAVTRYLEALQGIADPDLGR